MVSDDPAKISPDNPTGHWESRSLTDFNDELLAHLGGTWHAPPEPMPPADLLVRLESHSSDAGERFHRVHPSAGWVWKDPRLCLLLPFWIRALGADPIVVLTVRGPRDVARSLARRNGFGPAHATALWQRYTSAALRHCAGLRTVIVRYDRLVDDPAAQIYQLREALDHHGAPVQANDAGLEEAIATVDPELRHYRCEDLATEPATTGHVVRLLRSLGDDYESFPRLEPLEMDSASTELLASQRQLARTESTARWMNARLRNLETEECCRTEAVVPDRHLPTIRCCTRAEFFDVQRSELFADRYKMELLIARRHQTEERFTLPGFCLPCRLPVEFELDWQYAHPPIDATWLSDDGSPLELKIPNWRERILCPHCGMNNRQRAIAAEIREAVRRQQARRGVTPRIYLTEQVTPMFSYFADRSAEAECVGSEYLGPRHRGGSIRDGIRHENVEALSFGDASFDMVVSCSVLEHVNEPLAAIGQLARILRPGGELFLEVPFDISKEHNTRRAHHLGDNVQHLLPAEYHGDPMSEAGSLVFFDFGWEFFDQLREQTDLSWSLVTYWSLELGHLGGAQFFFHGLRD